MKSTVGGGYSPPCFSKPLPYPNPLPSGQTMSGGWFHGGIYGAALGGEND